MKVDFRLQDISLKPTNDGHTKVYRVGNYSREYRRGLINGSRVVKINKTVVENRSAQFIANKLNSTTLPFTVTLDYKHAQQSPKRRDRDRDRDRDRERGHYRRGGYDDRAYYDAGPATMTMDSEEWLSSSQSRSENPPRKQSEANGSRNSKRKTTENGTKHQTMSDSESSRPIFFCFF